MWPLDDMSAGPAGAPCVSAHDWSTRTQVDARLPHSDWTDSGGTLNDINGLNAAYPTNNGQMYDCYENLLGPDGRSNLHPVALVVREADATYQKTGHREPNIPC